MPLLQTKKTKVVFTRARVDVPEFGTDEETGEVYYVYARNLSISERNNTVQSSRWVDRAANKILYDYPQVAFFGAVGGKETDTDRGVRVFASVEFIRDLTPDFEPAITRIALKVLELSDLIKPQASANVSLNGHSEGETVAMSETGDLVGEAKKD